MDEIFVINLGNNNVELQYLTTTKVGKSLNQPLTVLFVSRNMNDFRI